jgi:hypothetical protein
VLHARYWLLVTGYWLLVAGYWLGETFEVLKNLGGLRAGSGYSLLVAGCWLLVSQNLTVFQSFCFPGFGEIEGIMQRWKNLLKS